MAAVANLYYLKYYAFNVDEVPCMDDQNEIIKAVGSSPPAHGPSQS